MRAIAAVCLSCLAALAAFAAIVAATPISSNVSVSWASSDVEDDGIPVLDELTNSVSSSQDNTLVDSTSSDTAISPTEMPLSSTPTFTEGKHWIELAMLRVRTYFTGVTCTDVQRAVRRVKWPDLPPSGKLRNFKCWPTFGDNPETTTNWTFDVNLYNTPTCGPKLACSLLHLLGPEKRKLSFSWGGCVRNDHKIRNTALTGLLSHTLQAEPQLVDMTDSQTLQEVQDDAFTSEDSPLHKRQSLHGQTLLLTEGEPSHWVEHGLFRVQFTMRGGLTCTIVKQMLQGLHWPRVPPPGGQRNLQCWPTYGDVPETATEWTWDVSTYNTDFSKNWLVCGLSRITDPEKKFCTSWGGCCQWAS